MRFFVFGHRNSGNVPTVQTFAGDVKQAHNGRTNPRYQAVFDFQLKRVALVNADGISVPVNADIDRSAVRIQKRHRFLFQSGSQFFFVFRAFVFNHKTPLFLFIKDNAAILKQEIFSLFSSDGTKEKASLLNESYRLKKKALSAKLLQKEFERLTVELAWKSSKIEGNTYTLLDTELLLKEHISAKGKTAEETPMVMNHKTALDYVLQEPDYFSELTVSKIEEIQSLLTEGLNVSKGIRQGIVGIVGTNYRPLDNIYQIKEALQRLIDVINHTKNPVEKALIAVLMIAYIQPFEDGSKRTSRILGNALLLANDYCPLSYRSVDEIEYKKGIILFYEQNNAFYFKKLFLEQFKQAVQA